MALKGRCSLSSSMFTGPGFGSWVVQRDIPQLAAMFLFLHFTASCPHSTPAKLVEVTPQRPCSSLPSLPSQDSLFLHVPSSCLSLERQVNLLSSSLLLTVPLSLGHGWSGSLEPAAPMLTSNTLNFCNLTPSNHFPVIRKQSEAGVTSSSGRQTHHTRLCLLWPALHRFYWLT